MKVLEADGVVKVHPRSGIEVIKPSVELVRSTFQFRNIIERAAVRQYCETATNEEIAALRQLHVEALEHMRDATPGVDQSDDADMFEDAFHRGIIRSLKNDLVDISYRRLHMMARVIKLSTFLSPRAVETTIHEHIEVLDACARRDKDLAEEKITDHLMNALARNLGLK